MDLLNHFRTMARYNRIANDRVYECCAQLEDSDYRLQRAGSFGSIHALLNHLLLGDQIWMARFKSERTSTPSLNTVLFNEFVPLRDARKKMDEEMEAFFAAAGPDFLERELIYVNSLKRECRDNTAMAVSHFFNHQTHHRGQIHVMLSQTSVRPPALDLHRIINP